jgi:hypothetical protein
VETEKCFLSAVIAELDTRTFREIMEKYPGITWRGFRDRRHQVIWRALGTLDLSAGLEERLNLLIEEDGGKSGAGALIERAQSAAWLERELSRAAVIAAAGGKKYIRELAEAWPAGAGVDIFAKKLKFTV